MIQEDSTLSLQVEIYSYYNCFPSCSKLRPAVRLPAGLFALSNSIPYKNPFIKVKASQVVSDHFKAKGNDVYLIKAETSAYRYNNISGGVLTIEKPNEKKFLGLNAQNSHIFSLTNNNKKSMKLLKIDFPQLKGASKENLGLSAESSFTPESAYDLAMRQANAGTLTEGEKEVVASDVWQKVFGNIQQTQLHSVLTNLPFPNATTEMIVAIPTDRLNEAIEYAEAVLSGNPAEASSISNLGVEGLSEWLGAADLSAYQTPAALEEVAAAIETAQEGTSEVAAPVEAPVETPVEGAVTEEVVPETAGEETVTDALPVPKQATQVVVEGGERYRSAKVVSDLLDQVEENIDQLQKTRKQIQQVITSGFLQNATLLDQQTLPASVETEVLAVEA